MSTPRIPYVRASSLRRWPVPGPDDYHRRMPVVPPAIARRLRAEIRHDRLRARIRARTLVATTIACYVTALGLAASAWFAFTPLPLGAAWYFGVIAAEQRAQARLFDAAALRVRPPLS